MNLPNKLTLLRIIMIPFFMVFAGYFNGAAWSYAVAGVLFALASFTDFLDGYLARKNHLVTDFGKFADPLADKLLTTTAFIYMMANGACSPIVLVIILAREFAVSGLRMVAAGSPQGEVIAANIWGKVKTVLQMLTIIVYYVLMALSPYIDSPQNSYALGQIVGYALCWLVALVTALSGIQYLWAGRHYINTAK